MSELMYVWMYAYMLSFRNANPGDLYINRVVLENQGLREKILQKEYFP